MTLVHKEQKNEDSKMSLGLMDAAHDYYLLLLGQEEEDIIINLFSIPLRDHSPDLQLPKGLFCPPVEHMSCG